MENTDKNREQLVRETKLNLLTHPMDDNQVIRFEELFDLSVIQKIQDDFAAATQVASLITTPEGVPITKPSRFSRLCNDIIRATEKGCANCSRSDAFLGRPNPNGPNIQHCLSGGLWDAGVSITLGGKQIACWLIGQVRDESMDLSNLRRYAREIGVDEATFMDAFEELPVMSLEQFTQVSNTLFTLANHLFLTSYMNLQQARMIEELKRTQLTLKANEEKFRMLFDNSMIGKSMTEIDGTLHVNKAFCDMLGYTEEELKALKWSDISHPDEVDLSRENVEKLLRGEVESASFEKRYLHKSGKEVWTLISTYLQRDLDGKPLFFITSVIDNTERKRVEEELLQANRNAEKLVQDRTAQLNQTIEKLEEQSRVFVGRELRMIELKEQIDQLQKQLAEKNKKET